MLTDEDIVRLRRELKKDFLTKEDAKNFLTKGDAKDFLTKADLKNLLTKDDAKEFLTKEDGKRTVDMILDAREEHDDIRQEMRDNHAEVLDRLDYLIARAERADQELVMHRRSSERHEVWIRGLAKHTNYELVED